MATRAHWESAQSPGLRSLNQLLLFSRGGGMGLRLCAKREGTWQGLDAADFYQQARAVAGALAGKFGAKAGDRAAILSESRPEWMVADFGCLAAGVIDVPIYPTLTAEQVGSILRDCDAAGVFVSSAEQEAKARAATAGMDRAPWIVRFDSPAWQEMIRCASPEAETTFAARLAATPGDQIATILYTSGTTGEPKGVVLTHANLCANLNVTTLDFEFSEHERRLSMLPLSHITERHLAYVDLLYGSTTYFAPSLESVPECLIEVKPTLLASVPRLFEKIAAAVEAQAAAKPALARRLFAWACAVGREAAPHRCAGTAMPAGLRWRAALADRLVGRKLRGKLGGRLTKVIAGGAPLGKDLSEKLLAMGLMVDEGYGLTETSPVVALNRPGGRRPGSVGRAMPNVEVRFAEDGELLVRGPSVFGGYWKRPAETAEALREGWFHTGDIGSRDEDGFLYITDRKKDLIKTSGGKFIAPQPIEAKLKASALVAEAVVLGDGRNYAVALLVPDWGAVAERGAACEDRGAACTEAAVRRLFQIEVDAVNATLARFETVKRFALLPEAFTVASGELTPTIKVRRRAVEARHRAVIEALYADGRAT